MGTRLSSKERMIAAMTYGRLDYIPASFMIFYNLFERCSGQEEFIRRQLELGLDAFVNVGKLELCHHPKVSIETRSQQENGDTFIVRQFETPAGPLRQKLRRLHGWPVGEELPLFDDRIVPRAAEVLVKPREDLEKVRYLFGEFSPEAVETLRKQAEDAAETAGRYGLLQTAGELGDGFENAQIIGVGDLLAWLSGYEDIMMLSIQDPNLLKAYITIISDWNSDQIRIYLENTKADLIVRRGWYENTDFWTPEAYRKLIAPTIKREADLVHGAGKLYGYIITSAFEPLLDTILESGIDVLIGLDPVEGKGTDIHTVKKKFLKHGKALWGGVSGPLTVERGTVIDTEEAVQRALEELGRDGGFILSPVDNLRENTDKAWENTYTFIDAWKRYRK